MSLKLGSVWQIMRFSNSGLRRHLPVPAKRTWGHHGITRRRVGSARTMLLLTQVSNSQPTGWQEHTKPQPVFHTQIHKYSNTQIIKHTNTWTNTVTAGSHVDERQQQKLLGTPHSNSQPNPFPTNPNMYTQMYTGAYYEYPYICKGSTRISLRR